MIRLEDVSLNIYESSRQILSGIDWHIKEGENWILFGRNGSGKTKLLEVVTGYQFPSRGAVFRFGIGQSGGDIREVRRRMGYVSSSLREKFSINERLIDAVLSGFYASIGLYREPTAADVERASALLCDAGLGGRESERIGVLSDGEKQRVLMARALISEPEILIFDEPTMGLDILAREELLDSIEKITAGSRVSIIYVTHHVEEIRPLFEKIFIIDDGRCFYNGEVKAAVEGGVFSSLFNSSLEIFTRSSRYYSILS